MGMSAPLYVVHCIDTEGPLYESLEATFERLESITGIALAPTIDNLQRVRRKELDLRGREEVAALIVSEQLLSYNDTWDKVDAMLRKMMHPAYRNRFVDSVGQGWVYSWFLVDHVGYETNPRRRDIGYHNVFDHYLAMIQETGSSQDDVQFHFHPMSTYREAHVCATSYLRSPHLLETLARRVVDRQWFPSCFRPGFHAERPDAHWFLEQWIPFDFANQATASDVTLQHDVAAGRLGDWRRAPSDWSPYHPDHDDYQVPGRCRRTIFRCLNVGTRFRLLDADEVDRAFARAQGGQPTVLAFTNHDFRDMHPDVERTHAMLSDASRRYPEVEWRHARALDAARSALGRSSEPPLRLSVELRRSGEATRLHIEANHDTFGPQPFLAVKTHDKRYLSDNLEIHQPKRVWSYTFDADTVPLRAVERIGVACNDLHGSTHVVNLAPDGTLLHDRSLG
jgi:hypothetical protein